MRKYLHCLLALCISLVSISHSYSQAVDDAFIKKNLAQDTYSIDSDASAIMLYEKTKVEFLKGAHGIEETRFVRKVIKILKDDALNLGNITDQYRFEANNKGYIDQIKGTTYNLEGNQVVETKLKDDDVFRKPLEDNYYEIRYNMPSVRVGSIIDYSYQENLGNYYKLPQWDIQNTIAKLRSEYELIFPKYIQFTTLSYSGLKPRIYDDIDKAVKSNDSYYEYVSTDMSGQLLKLWSRRDIPALKGEPYCGNLWNIMERMEVHLTGIGTAAGAEYFTSSWEKLNDQLWNHPFFGKQIIAPNRFLDKVTDSLVKIDTGKAALAHSIFRYVRNHYVFAQDNNDGNINLENVYNNGKGNVTDINMMLVAMMRHAGISASPVALSTVNMGTINKEFPDTKSFNYLVCMVNVDNQRFFLDAADKHNAYGVLPDACYNGYARIIDKKGDSVILSPAMVPNKEIYYIKYNLKGDTKSINVVTRFDMNTSARIRRKMDEQNSSQDFFISTAKRISESAVLTDSQIVNLQNPDTNVVMKYSLDIKGDGTQPDILYVNTNFVKMYDNNPFLDPDRRLPIIFPYKRSVSCATVINIPSGFAPDDLPQPELLEFGDNSIIYKKNIAYNESLHVVTINMDFELNDLQYPAAANKNIREFFTKFLKDANSDIVLKRK